MLANIERRDYTDGSIVDLDQIFYEVKGRDYPFDSRGKELYRDYHK